MRTENYFCKEALTLEKRWMLIPFVWFDKPTAGKLFDQETAAALVIGFIGIEVESGLRTNPGSRRAVDDWKDPGVCESIGAVKYW